MRNQFDRFVRAMIGAKFRGRFPGLYSTLDNPVEVPIQLAAYQLAVGKYIQPGDSILDVGFGLGYGLRLMSEKAGRLTGIEVDREAVACSKELLESTPEILELRHYDGKTIPYANRYFDVVTCIDVIEHVADYLKLITEMIRVSKRLVLLSTPNRRPEHTAPDGKPKNYWHLREWSFEELDDILRKVPDVYVDWNCLDGPWDGPFIVGSTVSEDTLGLAPALIRFAT